MAMRNVEDVYVLSPMQQGMLFYSLYAPEQGTYHSQWTAVLEGDLDEVALRGAWEVVVGAHGALRTGFVWETSGGPVQVVRRRVEVPWREEDWRGLSGEERERELDGLLGREREAGFELGRAPLLRLVLVREGVER